VTNIKDKKIHFCGIGGIGMSAIAEIMINLGYLHIQGSNIEENYNTKRLQSLGIKIQIGHSEQIMQGVDIIVLSTAIPQDNIELITAKNMGIEIMHRSDALNIVMQEYKTIAVAGCHGKTTTSSVITELLDSQNIPYNAMIGGIVAKYGSNAVVNQNAQWFVAESDESDGSFTKMKHNIAIITNIDNDHMESYNYDINVLYKEFQIFANNSHKENGALIVGVDSEHSRIGLMPFLQQQNVITYATGSNITADFKATNIRYNQHGAIFDITTTTETINNVQISLFGEHNVQNALSIIILAQIIGITEENWRKALISFSGVKRRFTTIKATPKNVFIDDYGHHPTEIKAVISAAKEYIKHNDLKRLVLVWQPHRYSRTQILLNEFTPIFHGVDKLFIDEIYAASEQPIEGITSDVLTSNIGQHFPLLSITQISLSQQTLSDIIAANIANGDLWIFMGAGSISKLAYSAVQQL
jgi:UDP-N-acetylmuramate--alanine ligase